MDARPVVVVTRTLPAEVEQRLGTLFDARLNPADRPLDATDLGRAMREADALLSTVTDRVGADLLGAPGRRLRLIANFGVGFDNVDAGAAREHGVVVTNTPDVLTDDTADLALALMLMAARRAGEGERHLRAGEWTGWRPTHMLGTRVSGRTLGIVGFGRIGRALARRASQGLGMRVFCHDPRLDFTEADLLGVEPYGSLDRLLAECDFVSLHVPATPETHHLIDARRLGLMRRTAVLVNTARGGVVDDRALAAALRDGTIAAAGLDVYENEPAVLPELLALENVVLLPHLGSATVQARIAMGHRAVDNLVAFFAGEAPRDRVA